MKKNRYREFRNKFAFGKFGGQSLLSCEREFFLTDREGNISPLAPLVAKVLPSDSFGYELSACQFEMKVGPVSIDQFDFSLKASHASLQKKLARHKIGTLFQTVAPDTIPLDVFPDPTGRYQRITQNMPIETLRSACRITGTHFHVGMPDHETALKVYNHAVEDVDRLMLLGDLTSGLRRQIYRGMAQDMDVQQYSSWEHLHECYLEKGYSEDPRKCWHLIRISVHGTIEFRMFDNTDNLELVSDWANECYQLCASALR